MSTADVTAGDIHLVAVPYPGRGHVNPMLCLCRQLLSRCPDSLSISFVVTDEWRSLILSSSPPLPPSVALTAMPNVIPSESNRAADFHAFLDAVRDNMAAPFAAILDGMSPPASAILADAYLPWAFDAGDRRGIPVYSFSTMSATFFSTLYSLDGDEAERLRRDEPGNLDRALSFTATARRARRALFTTAYELEPAGVPAGAWTVGPCIPYMVLRGDHDGDGDDSSFAWLDKQRSGSVLYVSLGSFLKVSPEQLDEIAYGVGASGEPFVWVARGDIARVRERVGGKGIVVPWCDQLKVLGHRAVGGFLTHCGWNSTLEAVYSGVPMLAFPIMWDQFTDRRLVVEEWKVGFDLLKVRNGDGVVGRDEIAAAVKKLMDSDDVESREARRRMSELRDACRSAVAGGGSSDKCLNEFIQELATLKSRSS